MLYIFVKGGLMYNAVNALENGKKRNLWNFT